MSHGLARRYDRYGGGGMVCSPRPRFRDGRARPVLDDSALRYRTFSSAATNGHASPNGVISVGFCQSQTQIDHNTDEYLPNVPQLVVRRGQSFKLDLSLRNVSFKKGVDRIKILFSTGSNAQESKGTLANVFVNPTQGECPKENDVWKAYIASINQGNIEVVVTSPPDAIVSAYMVTVKAFIKDANNEEKMYVNNVEDPMYLLFNAWCKDDQVYMDNSEKRHEYVVNDTGRVYVGSKTQIQGKPWVFGQFERSSLEAAMYLLNKSYQDKRGHGNATLVARALTAMANSCDNDGGVLTGNWSGNYGGGTSPTAWNGSVAILEEYMHTKRDVKYGQCWVFSGLVTTLCRTVGIPARSVTNFESAHDTDLSMTIDQHFSWEGEPLEEMNSDSVWNFHVWNEGWFERPDLPKGNDGWQAFDATPQEESGCMMRCGPAPLAAVKSGMVYLNYDTKFIFAEVNGDKITWMMKPDGDLIPLRDHCNTSCVGKHISTKAVGSSDREDVTHLYKHQEGSKQEREVMDRACSFGSRKTDLAKFYDHDARDVQFTYEGDCQPNGDIAIKLTAKNTSNEQRTLQLKIRSAAVYYTGVVGEQLSAGQETVVLDPGADTSKAWTLASESYLNALDEDAQLKVYVTAKVEETHQFFVKHEIYNVDKPDLILEVSKSSVRVGEAVTVTARFINPVGAKLTNGVLRLEGPGIQRNLKVPLHRSVEPGQEMVETVTLKPHYKGVRELVACFNSRQLTGITGAVTIDVRD